MKNDLIDLFRWVTKVDIKNMAGNVVTTLYIKLVGDVDYDNAQKLGLLASRRLRKKLKDNNSVEYQAAFLDIDDTNRENVILGILFAEITNFRDAAVADLADTVFETNVPEEAETLEEKEKKQESEENLIKERTDKLRTKMEEKSNKRREELITKSDEDLRNIFIESTINYKCIEEFGTVFREYCVFAGTYTDESLTIRAFSNFDEFRNSSTNLKKQLTDAYLKLELTGEQLKN